MPTISKTITKSVLKVGRMRQKLAKINQVGCQNKSFRCSRSFFFFFFLFSTTFFFAPRIPCRFSAVIALSLSAHHMYISGRRGEYFHKKSLSPNGSMSLFATSRCTVGVFNCRRVNSFSFFGPSNFLFVEKESKTTSISFPFRAFFECVRVYDVAHKNRRIG